MDDKNGIVSERVGFPSRNSSQNRTRFVRSQLFKICPWQLARDVIEWPGPALCLILQPIEDFKCLFARLLDDAEAQRSAIKDLVIFGIHAVIISNMNGKPGISPEIAQLMFFREPGTWSPAHLSACWSPDDKILVTGRYMIALPTGPLAAINEQFLDASFL